MNPLLAFVSLATDVDHANLFPLDRESSLDDAGGLGAHTQNVVVRHYVTRLRITHTVGQKAVQTHT